MIALVLMYFFVATSCSTRSTSSKLTLSSKRIYFGDNVEVKLRITGNKKNIERVTLNDKPIYNAFHLDTIMYFDRDTVVEFRVYLKGKKRPIYHKKRLRVYVPKVNGFMVYRDRFNPAMVIVKWDVEGVNNITIDRIGANLANAGQDTIFTNKSMTIKLIASSPNDTLKEVRYVEPNGNYRPFIKDSISISEVDSNMRLGMEIVETEIDSYPNVVTLKVLVYDTLGNLITNLAPPYNTEAFALKYFKRLTENVGNATHDVEFKVREIHSNPNEYDIALVLDYSGSMSNSIDVLEKATYYFVDEKHKNDRYSLVNFDDKLVLKSKLTNNKQKLLRSMKFEGLEKMGGGTAMYAAVGKGISTFDKKDRKKVVVLFTDGDENSSLAYLGDYSATSNEVIDALRENNTRLIIMGLGDVNNKLLRELSYFANGTYYPLSKAEEIYKVYNELNRNFNVYYEITMSMKQKEGEHLLLLEYNNNLDSNNSTTQRPVFIGSSYDFMTVEEDTAAYWYDLKLKQKNYKLAVSPQSLVNFELNEDIIDRKYYKTMNRIIGFIKKDPSNIVRIYGHTDTQGTEEDNQDLSERRAKAVYIYFLRHGIHSNRIKFVGYGETKPLWPKDNLEWKARENRRVEIVIWKKK